MALNAALKASDMRPIEWQEVLRAGMRREWELRRAEFFQGEPHRIPLTGIRLERIDLSGWDISFCDFTRSTLCEVNLTGANASDSLFRRAKLTGVNFSQANLELSTFSEAVGREINMAGANLHLVNLMKVNFGGFVASGARAEGCDFSAAQLCRANLENITAPDARLLNTDLSYANLRNCKMDGASFRLANLSDADLSSGSMTGADFTFARLLRSRFGGSDLTQSTFYACVLDGTDFRGAKMRGVIFERLQIDRANFDGADLDGAQVRSVTSEELKEVSQELRVMAEEKRNLREISGLSVELGDGTFNLLAPFSQAVAEETVAGDVDSLYNKKENKQ